MAKPLARRYAAALFEIAAKQGAVGLIDDQLQTLSKVLADREIRALALDPDSPARVRRQVLERLVRDAHLLVQNFVQVLLERRREEVLLDFAPTFHEMVLDSRGEAEGVVESATALEEETLAKLASDVGRLVGKRVTLSTRLVPDLLGGVRVRVGNTLYDGSVMTALDELRLRMLSAPLP